MRTEISRLHLIAEFEAAPDTTWFNQRIVAAIRGCSLVTIERDRWAGTGVPFVKMGRLVRYRKIDIRNWLQSHQTFQSTTQAQNNAETRIIKKGEKI